MRIIVIWKIVGTRAKILKSKKEELSVEEQERIIEELIQSKKIRAGQLIDYTYFKELYKLYESKIKEVKFATLLGISYSNYSSIKNSRY